MKEIVEKLKKSKTLIVGVDLGYRYTKVTFLNSEGKLVSTRVLGAVALEADDAFGIAQKKLSNGYVKYGGEGFYVADLAKFGSKNIPVGSLDQSKSKRWRVLLSYAIGTAIRNAGMGEVENVILGTGLPLQDFSRIERRKELSKELNTNKLEFQFGGKNYSLKLDVMIFPQGYAAFANHSINLDGSVNKSWIQGNTLVIDIGSRTMLSIYIDGIDYMGNKSYPSELGVSMISQNVAREIDNKYNRPVEDHEIDDVLMNKKIKVKGEFVDVDNIIEGHVDSLWARQQDFMLDHYQLNSIERIVLDGGGSHLLRNRYSNFLDEGDGSAVSLHWATDPSFSNSAGFAKLRLQGTKI